MCIFLLNVGIKYYCIEYKVLLNKLLLYEYYKNDIDEKYYF